MGMVENEGTPFLPKGLGTPATHDVFAVCTLIHHNSQFERQFVSNASLTPTRILCCHCDDQHSQVLGQWRASYWSRFPPPEQSESGPMPTNQCAWLNNRQCVIPRKEPA